MERRFIVTGGGTSGHINPALAIAGMLEKSINASGDTCRIIFSGRTEGLEGELVPAAGYEFVNVHAKAMPTKPSLKIFPAVTALLKGISECKKLIREFRPEAVISTGGFVSAPLLYAARSLKVPVIIHEANAFPGRANKQLSKGAALVMTGFPDQEKIFPKAKRVVCTGNPVRAEIFENTYEGSRAKLGLADGEKQVFAMGGSLGSATITNFVIKCAMDEQFKDIRFVLSVGKHNTVEIPQKVRDNPRITIESYIRDPGCYIAGSDVCILRAGAVTCAEITAAKACAIMVPYPYAAHDHQTFNAEAIASKGGGIVISDDDVKEGKLTPVLSELLSDDDRRAKIRQAAGELAVRDTDERIVNAINEALGKQ